MQKVYLVLKSRLVPFDDDYIVNGTDVLGVFETEDEAKKQALAVRSHLLLEGNREWDYVTVMPQQLHQAAYRQPPKPFKCKLVIHIEFSKSFKTSKVWWTTEPLEDNEFDELDGWGSYQWHHNYRSLVIETIGIYDGSWEEGKPNFNDLFMYIDAEWRQGEAKYWYLAEQAISAHKEHHPEQFI